MITSPEITEEENGADYFLVSQFLCRNLMHHQRVKLRWLMMAAWVLVTGMFMVFFSAYHPLAELSDYYGEGRGGVHLLVLISVLIGMGLSIYLWVRGKIIYKNLLRNSIMLKPYTVTLEETGVLFKQAHSQFFHSWQDVLAVEEKANYLLFYIGEGMASYLPLRFFEDQQEKERFVETAKNLWRAKQSLTTKG